MTDYGDATEKKIKEVIETCERSGGSSIIALAGVPGTGKSFIASIAAQRFTDEPLQVREIQFHQSFSYEEFIEGMRIDNSGAVSVLPGIFLEWNDAALDDPERRYVLLIEELTRANLSAVLGELMTYIEHRDRSFLTVYSRRPIHVAPNLTILATYNPTDRSAIDIDGALLRRLRIIDFPPSPDQLSEMLKGRNISPKVIDKLKDLFDTCRQTFADQYEHLMPFGHGIFAEIKDESPDLHRLWVERIRHLIRRPLIDPHPFADVIEQAYPWRASADFTLP
jgi:5-methylcytosine-specific restriction protein B